MRVLQFITELSPAGAERIVCELAKGLSSRGHEVLVVSMKPLPENDAIVAELRDSRIEVRSLEVAKTAPWRVRGLRGTIGVFEPDIVHSHLIHPNIVARLAKTASPARFKLVNTVHIAERRSGKWWHFALDRWTSGFCDVQTAVSKAVRDFHCAKTAGHPEKTPVVYNGLPAIPRIARDEARVSRGEWGVADCAKVIGSVGRLDWQKGYDLLLERLPEISEIVPKGEKWGLVILGEGKQRGELEKIAAERKRDNIEVKLPGFAKDAARRAGAFDLFVMPSRYEGFGLTLIEAMAHGLPIVAAKADSLPELMEGYPNGECAETADFPEAVRKWISAEPLPEGSGTTKRFSVEAMLDGYLEIYESLLSAGGK